MEQRAWTNAQTASITTQMCVLIVIPHVKHAREVQLLAQSVNPRRNCIRVGAWIVVQKIQLTLVMSVIPAQMDKKCIKVIARIRDHPQPMSTATSNAWTAQLVAPHVHLTLYATVVKRNITLGPMTYALNAIQSALAAQAMDQINALPAIPLINCYSLTIHRQLLVCVFAILVIIGQVVNRNVFRNPIQMHAMHPHISMKARNFVFPVILTALSVQVPLRSNAHTAHTIDNSYKTPVPQQAMEYREIVIVTSMKIRQTMFVKHMIVPMVFTLTSVSMAKRQSVVFATLIVLHVHIALMKPLVLPVLTTVR